MTNEQIELIKKMYNSFDTELFNLSAYKEKDKTFYSLSYGKFDKQCMENINVEKLNSPVLYTENKIDVLCQPVKNAHSYQVRTLTNLSDLNYYDVETIEEALTYTNTPNSFYTIKAIGFGPFEDSDFSNDAYRPGNPEATFTKEDTYTYKITVNRNATGGKTKLVIKDLGKHNDDFEYSGFNQNCEVNFSFPDYGIYLVVVQEVPIDEDDEEIIALNSDVITLTINVEV